MVNNWGANSFKRIRFWWHCLLVDAFIYPTHSKEIFVEKFTCIRLTPENYLNIAFVFPYIQNCNHFKVEFLLFFRIMNSFDKYILLLIFRVPESAQLSSVPIFLRLFHHLHPSFSSHENSQFLERQFLWPHVASYPLKTFASQTYLRSKSLSMFFMLFVSLSFSLFSYSLPYLFLWIG